MTVAELKAALNEVPDDFKVFVRGSEGYQVPAVDVTLEYAHVVIVEKGQEQ